MDLDGRGWSDVVVINPDRNLVRPSGRSGPTRNPRYRPAPGCSRSDSTKCRSMAGPTLGTGPNPARCPVHIDNGQVRTVGVVRAVASAMTVSSVRTRRKRLGQDGELARS